MNITYGDDLIITLNEKLVKKMGENIGYFKSMYNTNMDNTLDMK